MPRISVGAAPADAQRLVDAWVEYLSRWTWDWFVTLTFREAKHPEAAEKVLHDRTAFNGRRRQGAPTTSLASPPVPPTARRSRDRVPDPCPRRDPPS